MGHELAVDLEHGHVPLDAVDDDHGVHLVVGAWAGVAAASGAPAVRRSGAVVLVDDAGRLSGIFTDADLRRRVLADASVLDRPIAEVMTRRPEHLLADGYGYAYGICAADIDGDGITG